MYAETSYAGTPLFGERNPTPTHFQHIAAWQERRRVAQRQRECVAAYQRRVS
ncbi:hypothetical protein [Novosphingobium sp. HII-3]|uniref:hypothetical protein n=1 Tax=Novosphingobium sp. HII-3 TaxID=2075565 RepID=UPI001304F8E3|nr:hypothetical protein [Novosphingobium sp. HII-3]